MITSTQAGVMSTGLSNGKHLMASDVYEKSGGKDEALNPH